MKFLDGSHYKAKLSQHELTMIRLWLDTSACFPGTYAALGCGSYPVVPSAAERAAMRKRCGACHLKDRVDRRTRKKIKVLQLGRERGPRGPIYNLSRPEKSFLLLAPLAKAAGGLDLCKQDVFKTRDDPLYLALLGRLRKARNRLTAGKRFGMPGFRPTQHYIREMQRFGILPKNLKPTDPVDPYATDKAYWDSFDYVPPRKLAQGASRK